MTPPSEDVLTLKMKSRVARTKGFTSGYKRATKRIAMLKGMLEKELANLRYFETELLAIPEEKPITKSTTRPKQVRPLGLAMWKLRVLQQIAAFGRITITDLASVMPGFESNSKSIYARTKQDVRQLFRLGLLSREGREYSITFLGEKLVKSLS